jgi:hypothetical protein
LLFDQLNVRVRPAQRPPCDRRHQHAALVPP